MPQKRQINKNYSKIKFEEHLSLSLKQIEGENTKFYEEHKETLVEILEELHLWFDEFADKETTTHRKIRHHQEGIEKINLGLTKKYGEDY